MAIDIEQFNKKLETLTFTSEASSYLKEIRNNFKADFTPAHGGHYSHETMQAIINEAGEKLSKLLQADSAPVQFENLRKEWSTILVDYHTNNNWGYEAQKEKPKKILSEDQKVMRELLPYFGLLLLIATISKTAFFYYGMHVASNPTDEYKIGLIATLVVFFSAMIYFAWKKYK